LQKSAFVTLVDVTAESVNDEMRRT